MTDPKENEVINEELSTDELKSVSGGVVNSFLPGSSVISSALRPKSPQGSGSGKTLDEWGKKMNLRTSSPSNENGID